jgi:hypothetical protein
MSEKNEILEREENATLTAKIDALAAKMDAYQKAFDESFAAIEGFKDHAKKIVKLRGLDNELYRAGRAIDSGQEAIDSEQSRLDSIRTARSTKNRVKKTGRIVAFVLTLGCPFIETNYSPKSLREETQKLKELIDGAFEQIDMDAFRKTLADSHARITTILDETVKNCDLGEIHKSPHFSDALHGHEPLKRKFDAAAIARAALGEEEPPKTATAESRGTKLRLPAAPAA